MNIYIFLIYLVFITLFFKDLENKKLLILIILFPMFLSLATQVNIGTDYKSYITIFNNLNSLEYSRIEIGYLAFNKFLRSFSTNERILFVGVSFLQMILFYKILIEHQKIELYKNIPLYILIFCISTNGYISMYNTLRSSISALFFNLFILFLLKKEFYKELVVTVLGGSFHKSIYFSAFIVIFLKKILEKCYEKKVLISFFILCFFINRIDLIRKISLFIYNLNLNIPYKEYLISEHMFPYGKSWGIGIIVDFFICLFSIIFYKNYNKKNIFLYNLGIFLMGLELLFYGIPILSRFLEYFYICKGLIIYETVKNSLEKKYYYIGWIILLFYFLRIYIGVQRILIFNSNL